MAMLRVRCTKCSKLIPTDYDVDYETFKSLTDTERTLECPQGVEPGRRRPLGFQILSRRSALRCAIFSLSASLIESLRKNSIPVLFDS